MLYQWQMRALSQWTGKDQRTIQRWYDGAQVRKETHVVLFDAVREHNYPAPAWMGRLRPTAIMKRLRTQ